MNIQEYIDEQKKYYEAILSFLSNEEELNIDDELHQFLYDQFNSKEKERMRSILKLISKISKNHHRYPTFFNKIEQILDKFSSEIKQTFSNSEIFQIFKSNKRILYFLFNEKIITPDESLFQCINQNENLSIQFYAYFYSEFKNFFDEKLKETIESELKKFEINKDTLEFFDEKRKEGENDDYLCQMIRDDSVESFISHVNRKVISLQNSKIKPSLFETNSLLLKNDPFLFEYAAFYGSIQIVQYFIHSNVNFDESLWIYAIHSKNAELVHLLEKVLPPKNPQIILEEAIKCHHNDIADYMINNMLNEENEIFSIGRNFSKNIYLYGFKYINYNYFPKDLNHKFIFFYLCQYDYLTLVQLFVKYKNIDIKDTIIFKLLLYK